MKFSMMSTALLAGLVGASLPGLVSWIGKPAYGELALPTVQSGTIAFATENPEKGLHFLYVVDSAAKSICVYEFDVQHKESNKRLKLVAVRQYSHDQEFEEYNNDTPSVSDIKMHVQKARQKAK